MRFKAQLMNGEAMARSLKRMAHELLERNRGCNGVCLIGIQGHGVPMAKRLADNIEAIEGVRVPCGALNTTPYRDDTGKHTAVPPDKETDIPFDLNGMHVVLADDVIFTGRTVRAAMDAIISRGRPATIQLAVLVDRGHRELPIKADYIGKNVPTSHGEVVVVSFNEVDGADGVELYDRS